MNTLSLKIRFSRLAGQSIWTGALLFCLLCHSVVLAGSATWALNPVDYEHWGNSANWVPNTVPNGPDDIASFGPSNIPSPFLIANVELDSIVFMKNADTYNVYQDGGTTLTLSGVGVINGSEVVQEFDLLAITGGPGALLEFGNSATAGNATKYIVLGGVSIGLGSRVEFHDASTAGTSTFSNLAADDGSSGAGVTSFGDSASAGDGAFTNEGGEVKHADGGATQFAQNATAERGVFVCEGSSWPLAEGGSTQFLNDSTAAEANLTAQAALVAGDAGPGTIQFLDNSSAGNATLIAEGGSDGSAGGLIEFADESIGDTAKVTVLGNASLDLSGHELPGLSIGSLQGDGMVFLGANNLAIGSDSSNTTFAGVIQDGPLGGAGSIAKVADGTLTLANANLYTGSTTVDEGTLVVTNTSGSGTGSGEVQVSAGTIGGSGTISGPVMVGTGNGAGAFLAPAHGTKKQATLTIQGALTFHADGIYSCTFKARRNQVRSDQVIASGVLIDPGAEFAFSGQTRGQLRQGLGLKVIDNTAATPITGAFANLADGAVVTINGNKFQADYEGGDGNDLTLTVVP